MMVLLYPSLLALLFLWLTWHVVKHRVRHQVALGDGGHTDLQQAIAAHANAAQYIPLASLLLVFIEWQPLPIMAKAIIIHVLGIALVVGRVLHARAIVSANLQLRKAGMLLTLLSILLMVVTHLVAIIFGAHLV